MQQTYKNEAKVIRSEKRKEEVSERKKKKSLRHGAILNPQLCGRTILHHCNSRVHFAKNISQLLKLAAL